METNQPIWEFVANRGDANPIDHGGLFVYRDTTGVYDAEAEKLDSYGDDGDGPRIWEIHRFTLDRLKIVNGYMVPFRYAETWPHPVASYTQWFDSSLQAIAEHIGQSVEELREAFCSDNPCMRAFAYEAIGQYHGFENLDSYPLRFDSEAEVEARYQEKNKRPEVKS